MLLDVLTYIAVFGICILVLLVNLLKETEYVLIRLGLYDAQTQTKTKLS